MSENNERAYPVPSIRRLPLYLSFLRQLRDEKVEVVSSTRIAEELRLTGIQVRKDLAMTGIVGRPKIGHSINELIGHIECFLGWNEPRLTFLVGVGHLGTALLGYKGFEQENLNIVASFDNSPEKIGTTILGRPTYDLKDFAKKAQEMNVKCAILAVPAMYAQETANMMIEAGIQGIWNFAPVQLFVPEDVVVENVFLSSSLAALSQRMAFQARKNEI
ncbi:MAG: redox-sensing transcriptional repressor Rex [Planctomycetia bacterium]|nr:redox-sensing transcriptional repressor Rex [Planctomycetia bacterium]